MVCAEMGSLHHLRCCNTLICQLTFSLNCYLKSLLLTPSGAGPAPRPLGSDLLCPKISFPVLGLRGSLLVVMHHLSLSTRTKMPRMAFGCQLCPSEQGVTGCLIQHLQSQERGDFYSEQGIASTAAEHRRPRELPKTSSCGRKFWLDWSIIVDAHKATKSVSGN